MKREDFLCLMPLLILSVVPVVMMMMIAIRRNYMAIYRVSVAGFAIGLLSVIYFYNGFSHAIGTLFIFDGFSSLFFGLILVACLLVTFLSHHFLQYQESEREEYYIILFTAALGSLILAAATSFVMFFLGLETLSISLYILVAYRRSRKDSMEAAVKYLILASVSSAFLLFGMGLIYLNTGFLSFSGIASSLGSFKITSPVFLAGFSMIMVGIGFKLAFVPFHMWTPDVYEGAPVPVTAFIASVSKGAVMAVLLRFFYALKGAGDHNLVLLITVVAVLTMFVGNLLAIRQRNLKRILAYSSISNMGYLAVTLLVGTHEGISAAVFYIFSYIITVMGAFAVITLLSDRRQDADMLEDYKGLAWKRPWVATVLTLSMLSLAGIPLTAGFMAKFYIVFAGVNATLWILVISIIINSVIGLYYYLRVITTLFFKPNEVKFPGISLIGSCVLFILTIIILWMGIIPESILHLISQLSGL